MKIKMAKDDMWNIDLMESWLNYHFPGKYEELIYRKMIYMQVKKMLGKFWNNYEFLDYIASETIKELERRDWHPLCHPLFVRLVICDVFYDKHIKFMKKYVGIKVKRKKRR